MKLEVLIIMTILLRGMFRRLQELILWLILTRATGIMLLLREMPLLGRVILLSMRKMLLLMRGRLLHTRGVLLLKK